jgi:hypothetical protein
MGAHFYCITICGLEWHKTVWLGEPIEREKGRGPRSWKSQFAFMVASSAMSADDSGPVEEQQQEQQSDH